MPHDSLGPRPVISLVRLSFPVVLRRREGGLARRPYPCSSTCGRLLPLHEIPPVAARLSRRAACDLSRPSLLSGGASPSRGRSRPATLSFQFIHIFGFGSYGSLFHTFAARFSLLRLRGSSLPSFPRLPTFTGEVAVHANQDNGSDYPFCPIRLPRRPNRRSTKIFSPVQSPHTAE